MTTYHTYIVGVEPDSEVAYAIDESIMRDRIVYVPDNAVNREMLAAACEDCAYAADIEYWGESNGQEWRVHIRLAQE